MPRYWLRYTVTTKRHTSEHTRTLDTEFALEYDSDIAAVQKALEAARGPGSTVTLTTWRELKGELRHVDPWSITVNPLADPLQPVGWLFTLHLGDERTVSRFSWTRDNPFGELSAEHKLTVLPLKVPSEALPS
ncbi:hypothetical protein [Pseudomonas iridis]|uniref:hypothetical protein n=1 Tax=Pseudomonas iridis TaxID=2710587 RepID=UPI001B327E7A|nr:hypothetical protein [Pseudomonas iridis]MBP5971035.1 hypothetical protein [Pseudomonas iridis]